MPNLAGQYNFNELCIEAQASAPWVKKVQRLLGLVERGGSKGTRIYYTGNQVNIYSAVKKLRLMDLDFEDIKHIYELEQKFFKYPAKTEASMFSTESSLRLIISLDHEHVLEFDVDELRKHDLDKFIELCKEYQKMQDYVRTKARKIKEISEQLINHTIESDSEISNNILKHLVKKDK